MLEEVVRQLSHDLSLAEKAAGSAQGHPDTDTALKPSPATEREVKALNARVRPLSPVAPNRLLEALWL